MSIFSNFGRTLFLFSVMFLLLLSVGFLQSWDVALVVLVLLFRPRGLFGRVDL